MTLRQAQGDRVFRWTDKRDRQLRADRADGFSYRECANMIGGGVFGKRRAVAHG